jgi:hypothetical protein
MVMRTLMLPLPVLPQDYERRVLKRVSAADCDIGMRMALARKLHLTRHEALGFNAARDFRPWGLVLPGSSKENPKGRLAPGVNPEMNALLCEARVLCGRLAAGRHARAAAHPRLPALPGPVGDIGLPTTSWRFDS